jgi:hypothetical protein
MWTLVLFTMLANTSAGGSAHSSVTTLEFASQSTCMAAAASLAEEGGFKNEPSTSLSYLWKVHPKIFRARAVLISRPPSVPMQRTAARRSFRVIVAVWIRQRRGPLERFASCQSNWQSGRSNTLALSSRPLTASSITGSRSSCTKPKLEHSPRLMAS